MTSRSLLISALLVTGAAVGAWFWFGKDATHHEHSAAEHDVPGHTHEARGPRTPAVPVTHPDRLTSSVAPGAPLARTESTALTPTPEMSVPAVAPRPDPQPEARTELENVRFMVRDFQTRMHENPVGSNAEIMRAVMGGNPANATLGPPAGQSLNAEGELVDRWGTPYFFHQLSKTSMEIRSAGPDQQLWTADDLVTK